MNYGYNFGAISPYIYDLLLLVGMLVLPLIAQLGVSMTFSKYSRKRSSRGLTAEQVARRILDLNGLHSVRVERVSGKLTDHYDPRDDVVRLSESVYGSTSVASIGIAAHECGHAVQHATAYGPLGLRSALVPVVSFSSKWVTWLILGGLLLLGSGPGQVLMLIGIILYAMLTLFSLITLPVEVNASQRAVNWLQEAGITDRETTAMASDALHSAAYTYVVAALSSLATLIYYVLILMGGRRE
jgi:Zn-dependent membrane protease YugP